MLIIIDIRNVVMMVGVQTTCIAQCTKEKWRGVRGWDFQEYKVEMFF
jgi:hypothetical protein